MRTIKLFCLPLFVLIWSSCSISKNLPIPELTPVSFRNSSNQDSLSSGDLPFKTFISDPTVQRLIDTALKSNIDMQLALKNIDAAEVLFKRSKLGNIPELQLEITASSSRPSDNSLNGLSLKQFTGSSRIEDYNAGLALFWEADIWGKIRNQKAAALASYLQTTEARKAIQTRLVADVAQGYYTLLMLDTQLGIARKNVELADSTLLMIGFQFKAGQVTDLAIQQAQAQLLRSKQLVPEIEQAITLQENAISVLIGSLPGPITRGLALTSIDLPGPLQDGFPSSMLARRADIKSAEYALNEANAKVGIAKANLYPSLSITASGGINAFKASNWFNIPASLFGLATAGITQPIFQRGKLRTELEIAQIDREKTVVKFRQYVLNAVGEVSDGLIKVDKLRDQYLIAEQRTLSLQTASRQAEMLFKTGMANYLEVLTAQGNLLQSELEMARLKNEQLYAAVSLYRSLGGGWK